ncbi:PHP domain-containing protein [candidate division KSB1 bacterium]|nr:PHP domain-containing protein [candidate division KSB1 bacterium]
MLRWFKADLHIHTVLSACAELTMGPKDIVEAALKRGIDIIAITDHNSAENVETVIKVAAGKNVTVIPGMEVSTQEGVHFVTLFPDLESLDSFQDFVYSVLQQGYYDEELYGAQLKVDEEERIIEKSRKLFFFTLRASIERIVKEVRHRKGIVYPAHIDRHAYSIFNLYAHFPSELSFDAAEISNPEHLSELETRFRPDEKIQLITASDAHDIKDVGKKTVSFKLESPEFREIKLALKNQTGRRVKLPATFSRESAFNA